MRDLVTASLDAADRKSGPVDLIAELALPLPLAVICDMLGVSDRDSRAFAGWMNGLIDMEGGGLLHFLAAVPRGAMLMRFIRRLIAERRERRGDDLISALVEAEESGDRLGAEELVNMVFLLLFAGHETTVNLIGNGVVALLQHPEQLERLRAEPQLIDAAVEEMLRFGTPSQHPSPRYATRDVEVAGTVIPRGATVLAMLGSANRDEQVFSEPERLELGRAPNKHVAFGYGVHYCLGAPLARLEAKVAFLELVKRYPAMRLAVPASELTWRKSAALRGLSALPLHLGSSATQSAA